MSIRLFHPFYKVLLQAYEDPNRKVGDRGVNLVAQLSERWDFDDPETRLPYGLVHELLQASIEDTGDPCIGLHAAELLEPQNFDVVYYACSCCSDLREAIDTLSRYFTLINETATLSLQVQGDTAIWTYQPREGIETHYAATDFVLACVQLTAWRIVGGREAGPLEVHFTYPEPEDTSEYRRIFHAPVNFGASHNGFLFPADFLDFPLPGADSHLRTILRSHAERLLQKLPRTDRFSDRVRELVVAELRGGSPGLEHIANKLAISARTLRRRLAQEGTTHRELLDGLRRDLALRYVGQEGLIVSEIAFLLGFSHENAFRKAFKRWTGKSPAEFRQDPYVLRR